MLFNNNSLADFCPLVVLVKFGILSVGIYPEIIAACMLLMLVVIDSTALITELISGIARI